MPLWLSGLEMGGQEHRVLDLDPHYLKATYSGQFGFTVVAGSVYPGLAAATPAEYLTRLHIGNKAFGDDWRLEGVGFENGRLVVFTSQPTVVGEAASPAEIIAFMERRRLMLLNGVALGQSGALSFYRDLDQLAAFDAHPANVLKDEAGVILPIDLILVHAGELLAAQLETVPG